MSAAPAPSLPVSPNTGHAIPAAQVAEEVVRGDPVSLDRRVRNALAQEDQCRPSHFGSFRFIAAPPVALNAQNCAEAAKKADERSSVGVERQFWQRSSFRVGL